MRILIENGCPRFANVGDIVQLQVTLARLRARWPDAELAVITESPPRVAEYCPGAEPVAAIGRDRWVAAQVTALLPDTVRRRLGWSIRSRLEIAEDAAPLWLKSLRYRRQERRRQSPGSAQHHWRAFHAEVNRADLLVFNGGGYLADTFGWSTRCKLQTLAWAIELGKPVAMFGQGLGPIETPRHLRLLRRLIPHVSYIALREGQGGPRLLETLGYDMRRVAITGDDAIEPAYLARPASLGDAIGVGIRCAAYSSVGRDAIRPLLECVQRAAAQRGTVVQPVVISPAEDVTGPLDLAHTAIGEPTNPTSAQTPLDAAPADPRGTMAAVARCRVVVTGTYHAAVFALSQGVSVVALVRSPYYRAKFGGLAEQFGAGCTLLDLDGPDALPQLEAAIARAWSSALDVRPVLLAAAQRQARLAAEAYATGLALAIPPASTM